MKKFSFLLILTFLALSLMSCSQGKKNNKPVIESITSTSTILKPNQTTTITVTAVDEDDDSLDYSWEASGGSLNTNSGKTVVWIAPSTYKSYYIEVKVDDDEDKAHAGITIQVTEEPKLTGITFDSNTVASGGSITFTADTSPALTTSGISISWTAPDGGTFDTSTTATVVWTAPTAPGSYDIIVTVSDGSYSDTITVEVTVT